MAVVSVPRRTYRSGAGRIGSAGLFLALVAAAPATLALARLLPEHGPALALRLTAAAACVLLVPGGIFVRALGRPAAFGVALAASFVWSLAALAGALALTFAFDGTINTTLWLLAGFSAVALVPALMRAPLASEPTERRAVAGVAAGGAVFAGAVWWTASSIYGDGLFHLGRIRKLEAFDLASINVVDEFKHGGLHPGYAFPVWHSAVALVARIADVDPALALRHLPAILTPLAVVLAYAAGAALFRSFGAGVATAAAQVGLLGFSRAGTGSFDSLALPSTVARVLIAPALLALVFSLAAGGRRRGVLSIAAASLALALVHPTYAFFVAVPLTGFLVARAVLATSRRREVVRVAAALPAVLVPAGLYALWLKPIVDQTASHQPDAAERARTIAHYSGQVDVIGGLLRLAPEAISNGGAIAVGGLLAIPFAALAGPRRWAAYVLGGSLAVLGLLLFPWAFDQLSDAVSVSQSRRLAAFLPIPFALAGAAALLGRLRLAGCLAAFGLGGLLQLAYPGEFSYSLVLGGPSWPVWVALGGAAVGLVVAAVLRTRGPRGWAGLDRGGRALPRRSGRARRHRLPQAGRAGSPPAHPRARRGPSHRRTASGSRLLGSRDELPDRGLRARLRLSRPACSCRQHEREQSHGAARGRHRLPWQRQPRDSAPLPRGLDRRRPAPLSPRSAVAEDLRGPALRPLQAQFLIVNANDAWPRFSCSSSASTWSSYEPLGNSPVASSCAR